MAGEILIEKCGKSDGPEVVVQPTERIDCQNYALKSTTTEPDANPGEMWGENDGVGHLYGACKSKGCKFFDACQTKGIEAKKVVYSS